MNKLDDLINQSYYPVEISHSYNRRCYFQTSPSPQKIVIDTSFEPYEQFAILAHEIQHAKCFKNNCKCRNGGKKADREFCAFKAGIRRCFGYKKALLFTINTMRDKSIWAQYPEHAKACRRIIKTKLWQKALKIAERHILW